MTWRLTLIMKLGKKSCLRSNIADIFDQQNKLNLKLQGKQTHYPISRRSSSISQAAKLVSESEPWKHSHV